MQQKYIATTLICVILVTGLFLCLRLPAHMQPRKDAPAQETTPATSDEIPTDSVLLSASEAPQEDSPMNADILRFFYLDGIRYRASGDIQLTLPEGYDLLGHTDTREESADLNLFGNFEGEVYQKGDSFYCREDGYISYVGFVRDSKQED